ncbi:hypothetical protein P5Q57_004696, partial [Escherichia coli]|nr:hypothetical protein [Escherichia coli]
DVITNELEELRKEIEALKLKNAALENENGVMRKVMKGNKLSFDEELLIVKIEISKPTKAI